MTNNELALMPEQELFMTTKKPIVAYVGGIGAGKSWIACIKATKNALQGRNQLMIGLTYSQARDVLYDTLKKIFELFGLIEGVHYTANKSALDIQFTNGARIYIKSTEIGDKLRGYSVSDVYIDEAAYTKDNEVYKILLGRMRESEDCQMHLTTSPKGFNWVYDVAIDEDCEYIQVSTFKNPFLPDQYIINMMKQYTSTFIQQELYADFINITSGLFNADWLKDPDKNSTLQKNYANVQRLRFWDFAFGSNDGCDYSAGVLLARVGNDFVIEDIVRVRQEYTDLRKTIVETAQRDGRDTQIGFESAGQQKAIINDMSALPELRLYVKKSLKVAKYGAKMKRILPLASLAENGNLYISNICRNKNNFKNECNSLTMDDTHANDDMVDSCASAYILFNETFNGPRGQRSSIF